MPSNLHHAQEAIRAALGPTALPSVRFVSTVEDAVREADIAIDCVPDELESKLEIFCLLDRMAPPHTVLATPMTRHSISDLAACTYRPEKCIAIEARASDLAAMDFGAADAPVLLLRTPPGVAPHTIQVVSDFFRSLGARPLVEPDNITPDPASL